MSHYTTAAASPLYLELTARQERRSAALAAHYAAVVAARRPDTRAALAVAQQAGDVAHAAAATPEQAYDAYHAAFVAKCHAVGYPMGKA